MTPGPITIFECPKCDNLLSVESLYSSNTFGAKLFSDGKFIAPNQPEFPKITKCLKCDEIFWINKAKEVGEYMMGETIDDRWTNAQKARFLSVYEYYHALEHQIYTSGYHELFFRQRILWGFNDRVRFGEPMFLNDSDKRLYLDNINKLLDILDSEDFNQKILSAELNRNLGDFGKCMEILTTNIGAQYKWVINAYERECKLKNVSVFEFPDVH